VSTFKETTLVAELCKEDGCVCEREREAVRKESVYHFARREIGPAPSGRVGGATIEATTTDTVTELGGSIVGVNNGNGLRPRVGVVRVSAVVVVSWLRMHRGNGKLVGGIEVRMVVAMMVMMILLLLLLVLLLLLLLLEVVRVGIRWRRRRIRVR